MRCLGHLALVFALGLAPPSGAATSETVDELKAKLENARPEDRPELCIRIAQVQLRNADKLYDQGKVDEAREALGDIVTYSDKARASAIRTKKHLKNIEIDVRKIADKLRDVKRTLAFEDQAPVEEAIQKLEEIRTALLKEMFAKDPKKESK